MNNEYSYARQAITDMDIMVNELEFALDNISVVQDAMAAVEDKRMDKYANAVFSILDHLLTLHAHMRSCVDTAFRDMRAVRSDVN